MTVTSSSTYPFIEGQDRSLDTSFYVKIENTIFSILKITNQIKTFDKQHIIYLKKSNLPFNQIEFAIWRDRLWIASFFIINVLVVYKKYEKFDATSELSHNYKGWFL